MPKPDWSTELPLAITVCDQDGVILEMNRRSIETFNQDGGAALIGTNVLDCHPEPACTQLADMLKSQSKNIYTIEKDGVKKLICQTPWFEHGAYKGFVELSIELPGEMKHMKRE